MISLITKGPKTNPAPEHTDYKKEVIFGSRLGDLTAEWTHLKGNTSLRFYMASINQDLINFLYSIFKPYGKKT